MIPKMSFISISFLIVDVVRSAFAIFMLVVLCLIYQHNKRNPSKDTPKALYMTSFGTICTDLICLTHHLFILFYFPSPAHNLCQIHYTIHVALISFTLYCFLIFLLYRTKIVFVEPLTITLSPRTFMRCLISLHILAFAFILFLCSPLLCTFTVLKDDRCCALRSNTVRFATSLLLLCLYLVLQSVLLYMFARRLHMLSVQNQKVNHFRNKQYAFSISTLCASLVLLIIYSACTNINTVEYVVSVHQSIICAHVVGSFKWTFDCNCNWLRYDELTDHIRLQNDNESRNDSQDDTFIQLTGLQ
eukprot:18586_1